MGRPPKIDCRTQRIPFIDFKPSEKALAKPALGHGSAWNMPSRKALQTAAWVWRSRCLRLQASSFPARGVSQFQSLGLRGLGVQRLGVWDSAGRSVSSGFLYKFRISPSSRQSSFMSCSLQHVEAQYCGLAPGGPSKQTIPTLGPKVCKYYLNHSLGDLLDPSGESLRIPGFAAPKILLTY